MRIIFILKRLSVNITLLSVTGYVQSCSGVWTHQWRQDGASNPGTEATLHCRVVGNQLQPHTLSIRKTRQLRGWNIRWSCDDFLAKTALKEGAGERSWRATHWRSFLGQFSVQSVCETLDECVSSCHNHATIQTLSWERKGDQRWTGVSADGPNREAISACDNS